jgi:hypothetical protein
MNTGRVMRKVIPLMIAVVLSLSACADGPYGHDRFYYGRWGGWDGWGGWHDGWDGHWRHAGFARDGGWHGGWGHGLAGHGWHGGFGGHGGGHR